MYKKRTAEESKKGKVNKHILVKEYPFCVDTVSCDDQGLETKQETTTKQKK